MAGQRSRHFLPLVVPVLRAESNAGPHVSATASSHAWSPSDLLLGRGAQIPLWPNPGISSECGNACSSALVLPLPPRRQQLPADPFFFESPVADSTSIPHSQLPVSSSSGALPPGLAGNASGLEVPGVDAGDLFLPEKTARKLRSKDAADFLASSHPRNFRESDHPQESARERPSAHTLMGAQAKACSSVSRAPAHGPLTSPACPGSFPPLCSPSSSHCGTSFSTDAAVRSKANTGRPQLQSTRALQSRAVHPTAPSGGRSLVARRRSFFVDGGVLPMPVEVASSSAAKKQHQVNLTHSSSVFTQDDGAKLLRRKKTEAVGSISGTLSLGHPSSITFSSSRRQQPQIGGAQSPKHCVKAATCFKATPWPNAPGGASPAAPVGTVPVGRFSVSSVPSSFFPGGGAASPVLATHHPLLGIRSKQRQRGSMETSGRTAAPGVLPSPESRFPPLASQQRAPPDFPVSLVGENAPFAPFQAAHSEAESRSRQRGRVQETGGAPRPGVTEVPARQKPSHSPPQVQQKKAADRTLGTNVAAAQHTSVLQRKQRQLPAMFTSVPAPESRGAGTESSIADKGDRADSLRALYGERLSKRGTGLHCMAIIPGTPRVWQNTDSERRGKGAGGKETATGDIPLSVPVGRPLGHKRQKGSSIHKDNTDKAEQILDMTAADITVTKIRDSNLPRLLPVKETRQ
uniref:Uncharacterized protein n=1 Tax=Neospora caninum (strain Liverpool) TaxID=572307 RepID=A0A0F7UAJ4_NEOCL|nr:TPA: hypothetical protein BN1204_015025 [Neospora caninum Liverpool]